MGSACCREPDEIQGFAFPEDAQRALSRSKGGSRGSCGCPCSAGMASSEASADAVEEYEHLPLDELDHLLRELFRLHDLNGNGLLEIEELVQLNSKVAMLHHGKDTDLLAVKAKYRSLFRERLDPDGKPVTYAKFRRYVTEVLDGMDPDPLAQEMIVEQFAAEARSARAVFHLPSFSSHADQAFLPSLSYHLDSFIVEPKKATGTNGLRDRGIDELGPKTTWVGGPKPLARMATAAKGGA